MRPTSCRSTSKTSLELGSLNKVLQEDGKRSIMITWSKRLLLTCTILGLLASNVLTVTSTAFNTALSGLMGTAYELYEACENMKDLDELYAGLVMENEVPGGVRWSIVFGDS